MEARNVAECDGGIEPQGKLSARYSAYDPERLVARLDSGRNWGIWRLVREVLCAGEETHVGSPVFCDVVTDRSAQHGIARLECVENGALRDSILYQQFYLSVHMGQGAQMGRQNNFDHGRVWTSTDSTDGRSRTMGVHASPASAETYTWPPVVPM